jgi:Flp pilus assembly protein TadG
MHRSRAQSLVELALAVPILLWFALGTLDFGRVFFTQIELVNAAREGARAATLGKDATIAVHNVVADATPTSSCLTDRCTVTITDYGFEPITPFISAALGDASGTIRLSAAATMPILK